VKERKREGRSRDYGEGSMTEKETKEWGLGIQTKIGITGKRKGNRRENKEDNRRGMEAGERGGREKGEGWRKQESDKKRGM
jgi:hypothetical protein